MLTHNNEGKNNHLGAETFHNNLKNTVSLHYEVVMVDIC